MENQAWTYTFCASSYLPIYWYWKNRQQYNIFYEYIAIYQNTGIYCIALKKYIDNFENHNITRPGQGDNIILP